MRIDEVSQISQRMVYLRTYEILVEANQALVKQDGSVLDAGYPFCYFTGQKLKDLLDQTIFWQGQGLRLRQCLEQRLPDLSMWLVDSIENTPIDEFFQWQPTTTKIQELVDDVKQRVLEVVDAAHAADRLQNLRVKPQRLELWVPGALKQLTTAGIVHSIHFQLRSGQYHPIVHEHCDVIPKLWPSHALIHSLWQVTISGGHLVFDPKAYEQALKSSRKS